MCTLMAKFNLFAKKAGMIEVCEKRPSKEAMNTREVSSSLGFNLQFLGSHGYVLLVLWRLKSSEITQIKNVLIKDQTLRFLKYFVCVRRVWLGDSSRGGTIRWKLPFLSGERAQ